MVALVLGTRERIEHVSCVVSVEQRSVFLSVAVEPAVSKGSFGGIADGLLEAFNLGGSEE